MTQQIDWYYRRSGCNTCSKMDQFLEEHGIHVVQTANANSEKLDRGDALQLAGQVQRIVAARGKSVVEMDLLQDEFDEADIAKRLVGPTGNLRAPTIRSGKTLLVGFNADAFSRELS